MNENHSECFDLDRSDRTVSAAVLLRQEPDEDEDEEEDEGHGNDDEDDEDEGDDGYSE